MRFVYIVELHVTVNNIEILSVALECFMANLYHHHQESVRRQPHYI